MTQRQTDWDLAWTMAVLVICTEVCVGGANAMFLHHVIGLSWTQSFAITMLMAVAAFPVALIVVMLRERRK